MAAVRFFHAHQNILNNIVHVFKPGVIGGNHRQIGQTAAHFAHFVPADLRAVTARAEEAHKALGVIFPKGRQNAFHTHGIVGVIDQQRKVPGYRHRLHPAFYVDIVKPVAHGLFVTIKVTAHRHGRQGVIHAKAPRNTHIQRKVQRAFQRKVYPQVPRAVH